MFLIKNTKKKNVSKLLFDIWPFSKEWKFFRENLILPGIIRIYVSTTKNMITLVNSRFFSMRKGVIISVSPGEIEILFLDLKCYKNS
jgi:hypothetical protein